MSNRPIPSGMFSDSQQIQVLKNLQGTLFRRFMWRTEVLIKTGDVTTLRINDNVEVCAAVEYTDGVTRYDIWAGGKPCDEALMLTQVETANWLGTRVQGVSVSMPPISPN